MSRKTLNKTSTQPYTTTTALLKQGEEQKVVDRTKSVCYTEMTKQGQLAMSNTTNTQLADEATFHADYWDGTPLARAIRLAYDQGDLDSLATHIKKSQDLMFRQEYEPYERSDVY